MQLKTEKMTETQAKELCTWRYSGEYYIYNCSDWEKMTKNREGFTNPQVRHKEFYAVLEEQGKLWGYYRLKQEEDDVVMIGLGLHPDYCGQGNGTKLMQLLIKEAKQHYKNQKLRLEVREWNKRAKRCYEKAGFAEVDFYERNTPTGAGMFFLMEYQGK